MFHCVVLFCVLFAACGEDIGSQDTCRESGRSSEPGWGRSDQSSGCHSQKLALRYRTTLLPFQNWSYLSSAWSFALSSGPVWLHECDYCSLASRLPPLFPRLRGRALTAFALGLQECMLLPSHRGRVTFLTNSRDMDAGQHSSIRVYSAE